MSVYLPPGGKTWRFQFTYKGTPYKGTTGMKNKPDAILFERELQLKLAREAGGIAQFYADPKDTPRIQDWAEVYLAYKTKRVERPDAIQNGLAPVLRFFGARPTDPAKVVVGEPYHDYRLGDIIAHPQILLDFETWMDKRGSSNQTKNHYRGHMRRMYAVAKRPEYRSATGITSNPFLDIEPDYTEGRTTVLSIAQVRNWLTAASYHIRLAVAIAALAPKLRLRNVLALDWTTSFDPDPRTTNFNPRVEHYIVVRHHKTLRKTRKPLVSPVTTQLLLILKDAWTRHLHADHVVTYHGKPVKQIVGGMKAAARACGIPYGRFTANGATFHTIRHTAATFLSDGEVDPLKFMDAMGHSTLAQSLEYRHMKPKQQRPALNRLSRTMKIADLVTAKRSRGARA